MKAEKIANNLTEEIIVEPIFLKKSAKKKKKNFD